MTWIFEGLMVVFIWNCWTFYVKGAYENDDVVVRTSLSIRCAIHKVRFCCRRNHHLATFYRAQTCKRSFDTHLYCLALPTFLHTSYETDLKQLRPPIWNNCWCCFCIVGCEPILAKRREAILNEIIILTFNYIIIL